MILDLEAMFNGTDGQEVITTEVSDNVIELPKRSHEGTPMRVLIQVIVTYVGGTSVAFVLETDALAAFGSGVTIASVAAIPVATLVAGYKINIPFMPRDNEEFVRLSYTLIGGPSAGTLTAGIIFDDQTNRSTFPPA